MSKLADVLNVSSDVLKQYFDRSDNHLPVLPKPNGHEEIFEGFEDFIQLKFEDDPQDWINPKDLREAVSRTKQCEVIKVIKPNGLTVICYSRGDAAKVAGIHNCDLSNLQLQLRVSVKYKGFTFILYCKKSNKKKAQRSSNLD